MAQATDRRRPGNELDWAVWTRVGGPGRPALDLMHARLVRNRFVPHMHEEFSIGVCTGGVEAIDYRGIEHVTGPGTIVVIEPGEPHTGVPSVPEGFTYRVLYPAPDLLTELADAPGGRPPRFGQLVFHDPELAARLSAMHAALASTADPLAADSRLVELLAVLVRRHALPGRTPAPSGASTARVTPIARPVMDRLAERLTSPPTLAELAGDLGLSRYQLLRAFRAEVGMPPYAWLAQYRVARARTLLAGGGRPADVATLVGFADQAHLTRWFRRVVGVTPGAFRNSVQDAVRG
jgi:AraC-like DNA-binding protein